MRSYVSNVSEWDQSMIVAIDGSSTRVDLRCQQCLAPEASKGLVKTTYSGKKIHKPESGLRLQDMESLAA
jgi:hypothetical protein